jgi:hypothetical protein
MADFFSYVDILHWREDQITKFHADYRDETFSSNVVLAFFCLPVLGLMVSDARMLRLAIFAITAYLGVDIICNTRSIYGGNGWAIGLLASTWILHTAVHLLLTNPERDFQRLEYTQQPVGHRPVLRLNNGDAIQWQPYPDALLHRLSWVVDLLFTLRGSAWNWRIDSLRPLPTVLQASVLHPPRHQTHDLHNSADITFLSLLLLVLKQVVIGDFLFFFAKADPYFWGITEAPPLPESPLYIFCQWPLLIRTCRMLVAWVSLTHFLKIYSTLGHLLRRVVAWATFSPVPYHQSWLNTPLYGTLSAALDSGLAGFWGSYWHQLYRYDTLTFSAAVLSLCPSSIRQHVMARRIIRMLVTFLLVGLAHSCASYTALGPTRPIRAVLIFFMMQSLGIIIQMISLSLVPAWLHRSRLRRVANFFNVFCWFLACAPLLFDDYTSSGLYAIDQLPVTVKLSGMLFPVEGLNVYLQNLRVYLQSFM